jgi:hypothetical protein
VFTFGSGFRIQDSGFQGAKADFRRLKAIDAAAIEECAEMFGVVSAFEIKNRT